MPNENAGHLFRATYNQKSEPAYRAFTAAAAAAAASRREEFAGSKIWAHTRGTKCCRLARNLALFQHHPDASCPLRKNTPPLTRTPPPSAFDFAAAFSASRFPVSHFRSLCFRAFFPAPGSARCLSNAARKDHLFHSGCFLAAFCFTHCGHASAKTLCP